MKYPVIWEIEMLMHNLHTSLQILQKVTFPQWVYEYYALVNVEVVHGVNIHVHVLLNLRQVKLHVHNKHLNTCVTGSIKIVRWTLDWPCVDDAKEEDDEWDDAWPINQITTAVTCQQPKKKIARPILMQKNTEYRSQILVLATAASTNLQKLVHNQER